MSATQPDFLTCTREEARELDRQAIEELGIPACILMENAGRACSMELLGWPELQQGGALVLCGLGNNGGDGLVIARTLSNHGVRARVLVVGAEAAHARASEEVQLNLRLWRGLGGQLDYLAPGEGLRSLSEALEQAGLLVDALFGTGLARELGEPYRSVIEAMNASGLPTLAVDMPSGIDANTGRKLGSAVVASATATLATFKHGQFIGEGPRHCGRLIPLEIGIPIPG